MIRTRDSPHALTCSIEIHTTNTNCEMRPAPLVGLTIFKVTQRRRVPCPTTRLDISEQIPLPPLLLSYHHVMNTLAVISSRDPLRYIKAMQGILTSTIRIRC